MDLYRFEAVLVNSIVPIVVVAQSEEQAFKLAEIELEKHFYRCGKEISLFEKEDSKRWGICYP